MNTKTCRHFNGVIGPGMRADHVPCKAGEDIHQYKEHDGNSNIWPCFKGNCTTKKCQKFDPYTQEEVDADEKEWDQIIQVTLEARRRIPKDGTSGTVECPKCSGELRWSRSSHNGHVRARCETPDCTSWME